MRRFLRSDAVPSSGAGRQPTLSFDSWDLFPRNDPSVVVICHPDWRGVRTAAFSFREPVIECDDLARWGGEIVNEMRSRDVETVVVHGLPPGSAVFLALARTTGIGTRVVLHSSMTQHGAEPGEAEVADTVLALSRSGTIDGVGFVKAGLAEAFAALGHPVSYVPNRTPNMPAIRPRDLEPRLNVGVFAESFWRKNVVTQLAAVALLEGATAHVLQRPDIAYLDGLSIVDHGVVPWEDFVSLQASTDVNLYATLSECHPLSPIESYLSGVPALISRTSDVFRSDRGLWDLTTVEVVDDPSAIAAAAERLLANRSEAIDRARSWIEANDRIAQRRWNDFVKPTDSAI